MADLISVIVSTYNRADALDAVLRSLSTQSDRNFEIIAADDGSRPDTSEVVARWTARAGVPVKHVWHEDRGFRLAEIRNCAILASQGTYCIFLDGDCLAQPGFIAAHRAQAQPGWFVTGSRLLLSQALTERVLADGLALERWDLGTFIGQRLRGGINRVGPLLLPWSGASAKRNERRWRGARGSNMAFWRADLDAVDGFDAAFVGWGREDSDMFARMIQARHSSPQRAARDRLCCTCGTPSRTARGLKRTSASSSNCSTRRGCVRAKDFQHCRQQAIATCASGSYHEGSHRHAAAVG